MNQEKISKFIAKKRKEKKLTQAELAEKLGVSEKSISNWENNRNMPDLSLFEPLCKELDITINELLSGEEILKKDKIDKYEKNIINTINYSTKKDHEKNKIIALILITLGIFISYIAMSVFPSESSFGSIYAVIGGTISVIGIAKITKKLSYLKRVICNFLYFTLFTVVLLITDYIGVITFNQVPRFSYNTKTINNMIIYKAPFYNVYRINHNTKNEYFIIDTRNEYTEESVPNIPFNRTKSGIDNIIKYKNKYLGNNSNTSNLINNLPLSEYGYTLELDSTNLGIIINYHITDWYINENYYLEKSLIYNSVSIFSLIENTKYIKFNFSGVTYYITREEVEEIFPNYDLINKDGLNKKNFNEYLEKFITNNDMVPHMFKDLFIDENLNNTNKIVIKNNEDKILSTINNKKDIAEIIELIGRATKITGPINLDGNSFIIYMYDNEILLNKFLVWRYNGYSSCFGFDSKDYKLIGLDGKRFYDLLTKTISE